MIRFACLAITIAGLLACSDGVATSLTFERSLSAGPNFTAHLVSYRNDGLKLHAMVAVPRGDMPIGGYPVVVANHGFVPDPRKYGITAEGVDSRPGDYYRAVPELFASRGFLVVIPDFRGHNNSEGFEQIEGQNREAISLYADDVIALLALLGNVENANLESVFIWSHSMGGGVSMRTLLASDMIKGASFWSTMDVGDLRQNFGDLDVPLMIQHSVGDQTTPVANAKSLAKMLESLNHPFTIHTYPGTDHYFGSAARELAADRDAEFFSNLISSP